ncbi:MAG: 2-dehydropantoate 2-reductase [Bacteroidota bacterium]
MSTKSFVVVGTGGVGGFFGAKLANAGLDVRFIARGAHLAAMKKSGLSVKSSDGDFFVPGEKFTDNPEIVGKADVILFCVKSYDTETAARQLGAMLHDDSIVITLQNGVDNREKIQSAVPRGTVYGGVAYVYSRIVAPGQIVEGGGPKKIIFGPENNVDHSTADEILRIFLEAKIDAARSVNILGDLWKKFVFITGASGITALTRLTMGEILAEGETRALLRDAMTETYSIARAKNIDLPSTLVDDFFETMSRFKNDTRSSLYNDLINAKPLEIEGLAGTVVRFGNELGIPTPVQSVIYASLLPYHRKHLAHRS